MGQHLHPDIDHVVFSVEEIRRVVADMGRRISQDYAGESLVVVCVLRGAAIFMADLVRELDLPVEMDFMTVSSYGNATKSSGSVRILKDLDCDIQGRHVLIVEDVVDSGLTLSSLASILSEREPASLEMAVLLHKCVPGQAQTNCKYVGLECPDDFIVGYGLDFAQRYRNLPYIGVLKEHARHS